MHACFRVTLMDKLGEGQYGVVRKGCFYGSSPNTARLVAAKTLKG